MRRPWRNISRLILRRKHMNARTATRLSTIKHPWLATRDRRVTSRGLVPARRGNVITKFPTHQMKRIQKPTRGQRHAVRSWKPHRLSTDTEPNMRGSTTPTTNHRPRFTHACTTVVQNMHLQDQSGMIMNHTAKRIPTERRKYGVQWRNASMRRWRVALKAGRNDVI